MVIRISVNKRSGGWLGMRRWQYKLQWRRMRQYSQVRIQPKELVDELLLKVCLAHLVLRADFGT